MTIGPVPGAPSESVPRRPQPTWRRALRGLQIAASVGLLAWIVWRVDGGALKSLLGRMNVAWWAAGMLLILVQPIVAASRTCVLLRVAGADVRLRSVLALNLEAVFFSLVLPGDLAGGVVRWARINKKLGSSSGALALVLVERLVDWFALGLFAVAGAGLLFRGEDAAAARLCVALAGSTIVVASGSLLIGARSASLRAGLNRAAARFPQGFLAKVAGGAVATVDAVAAATRDAHVVRRLAVTSLAYWLLAFTGGVLIARAVHPDIAPLAFMSAAAAIAVLSQLPVTFAGLGLREASFPVFLAAYGVDREVGLLLGLSLFLPTLILAVIGGVLHLLDRTAI